MSKCPIKPLTKRSLKKDITLNQTAAYVNNFYSKLKYAAGLLADGNHHFLKMRENLDVALHGAVNTSIQRIGAGSWLENWMATTFAWRKQIFKDALSTPGAVNERLLRTTNAAFNVFKDFVANEAVPLAKRNYDELRALLPDLPRKQIENIIHDAAIVGSTGEIMEAVGEGGRKFLEKRLTRFMEELGELGLSEPQINRIIEMGKEYADIYRVGQAYLMEVGVNMERLPGYVPIVFDKRIQGVVTKKFPTFQQVINKSFINIGDEITGSSALKSRMAFAEYVVNDIALLKEKFKKIYPNLSTEKILEWMENGDQFKAEVIEKLSDAALDTLLEEGVLSRVPSLHSEIIETLMRRDGVPLGLAEDIFISNPIKALTQWGDTLERITKESFAVRDLLTNGIAEGWVVGKEVAQQYPKQFVQLNSLPLVTKYFDPNTANAVSGQFIHKIAAEQLNTVLELNSNPIAASYLGTALNAVGRYASYFGRGLLGNPVTAIAQITQNAIQATTAVGTPMFLPKGFEDAFKLIVQGFDAFSDDVFLKFGDEVISEKDLVYRMVMTRGGFDVADITKPGGLKITEGDIKRIFDFDFQQIIRKQWVKLSNTPLETIQEGLDAVTATLFKQTAFTNFFSDIAGRMAILRTIDHNPKTAEGILNILGTKIDSVEAALRYTDEYIGFFDGKSELGNVAGRFVRPFFTFLMNAPGQTVRHAMRHPRRFANALSLYHHYAVTEGRRNYGYDKESWNRGRMLVPIWQNPVTKERVLFSPSTLDNTLNTIEIVDNLFNTATRLFGGNTRDKVADLEARSNPAKTVSDFVGTLWANNYFDTIKNVLSGRNSFTGADPNPIDSVRIATWFGIPMSPQMRAILQLGFPWSNQMERLMPAQIVGKRAVKTPLGENLEEPVPSIFGAIPESGGARGNMGINAALGVVGIRPVYSDVILNLTRTQNDLDRIRADAVGIQRYLLQQGRSNTKEFEQVTQVIREVDLIKLDVNTIALESGVAPPEAIRILKERLEKPNSEILRLINQPPWK